MKIVSSKSWSELWDMISDNFRKYIKLKILDSQY